MALELWNRIKTLPAKSVGTPVLVLMCLGMVMLPMPAFLLDMFFTFNITISMLILFVTIYTKSPRNSLPFRRCCLSPRCSGFPSMWPPPG